MELADVMRSTHACREYAPDPVPDDVFARAIELARFAPQGGNRQGVRFVVVKDPARKLRLQELYLESWRESYRAVKEGRTAIRSASGVEKSVALGFSDPAAAHERSNRFAERLGEHPAIVVVCGDPGLGHPTDVDLDRLSIVGGASVYPMAWSLCLALRDQGVATTFTTLLVAHEPDVKELLGIPDPYVTACHIVAGYPAKPFPTRLRRLPVQELAFRDAFGEPLSDDG
jgi:nitroreductase